MEKLIKALERFELPIYYAEVPEGELEGAMHFFYYRQTRLERSGTGHFLQTYEVAYVSEYQDDLMEEDIINAIEDGGLKFKSADYERVQMAETNKIVDIVIFTATKPLKRSRCM